VEGSRAAAQPLAGAPVPTLAQARSADRIEADAAPTRPRSQPTGTLWTPSTAPLPRFPSRAARGASDAAPELQVEIDRIDVRLEPPAAVEAAAPEPGPDLTLDAYLERRRRP
jgi:hypothetical protein